MVERVEITDKESAKAWLEQQGGRARLWFSCRSALRALPTILDGPHCQQPNTQLRAVYSLVSSSSVAAATEKDLDVLLDVARQSAITAPNDHAAEAAGKTAYLACSDEEDALRYAIDSVNAAADAIQVRTIRSFHTEAGELIGTKENAEAHLAASIAAFFAAASEDAKDLLNWSRLWPQDGQPASAKSAWQVLKTHWTETSDDWSFWIEWYEAFLNGTPLPWQLNQRIALEIKKEEWEAGLAVVGTRIAEIRAAYEVESLAKQVTDSAYLAQPGAPGIGHNQPPSLIDEELPTQPPETLIWVAASALLDEAVSEAPKKSNVQKATGILIAALRASGLWVAQKLDNAITEAAGAFGKAFGAAAGVSGLAYITGYSDKIILLVEKVLSWLPLIG